MKAVKKDVTSIKSSGCVKVKPRNLCLIMAFGFALLLAAFLPISQVSAVQGVRTGNLRIQYYVNPAIAFAALQAGDIDCTTWPLNHDQYALSITDPNIVLGPVSTNDMFSFDLNCNETITSYPEVNSPTSYVNFRAALACLTDKQYITNNICGGFATRMDVPVVVNAPTWRNMSVIYPNYPYEYNPVRAAALLTGAGFVEGSTVNTYYDSGFPGSAQHVRTYPSYAVVHDNPQVGTDVFGPPYSWTLTFTAIAVSRVRGIPIGQNSYVNLAFTFGSNTVTVNVALQAGTYLWIEYTKAHPKAEQDLDPLTVYVRSDDPLRKAAGELIVSNMRMSGIPIYLREGNSAMCYDPVIGARDYHIYTGYQLLDRYPTNMYELYHSCYWFPYGKNYLASPCPRPEPGPSVIDPNYDICLEDIYYANDIPAAILACQRAQSIHVMQVVNIPLWSTRSFYAWRSWVLGLVNEAGYGPLNAYTFMNAYKAAGAPEPTVLRIGINQNPRTQNVLYSQLPDDYALLDRYWERGQAVNPYDLGRDQPWVVQDWTPTTWVDPDDGGTKTACVYWLRKDVRWAAPETGNYIRSFTAHDVEFSDMFSYYFADGAHWNNVKDIDHIEILDDYTFKVCFSLASYWFQYAATYPLLPKNEWGALFCTPTTYTELGANYAAGSSLILGNDGVAQIQNVLLNGAPFTNYWVRFNCQGDVCSARRIYFKSALSGDLVINYWNITGSPRGYYPGSDTDWMSSSYSIGEYVPVDITKDTWAVFKRNSYFFLQTPPLGEVDMYWWWGARDTSRPLGGPRRGDFVVDSYDVAYVTVSYGSSGYLEPTTSPPWFPGADLAPSYTEEVPYGGKIDGYDVAVVFTAAGWPFNIIALTGITTSMTAVGRGYCVNITIIAENQWGPSMQFDMYVYADGNIIKTFENVNLLEFGNPTILTFTWNTTDTTKGNYTISAYVPAIQGETATTDNYATSGLISVTIPGDVDGNSQVDIYDVTAICVCYNSKIGPPPDPLYYPNCDLDSNGVIDIFDVTTACITYGQKDP